MLGLYLGTIAKAGDAYEPYSCQSPETVINFTIILSYLGYPRSQPCTCPTWQHDFLVASEWPRYPHAMIYTYPSYRKIKSLGGARRSLHDNDWCPCGGSDKTVRRWALWAQSPTHGRDAQRWRGGWSRVELSEAMRPIHRGGWTP